MNQSNEPVSGKKPDNKMEIQGSQDVQGILFSTITKKLDNPALSRSSVNQRTVAVFKNVLLSQLNNKAAAEITSRSLSGETEQQRERFLIDLAKINDTKFIMQKKGKTVGGIKVREVHLKDGDFFKFSQTKGSKEYPISTNFLAQTKEEYDIYRIGLPWISKGEYAKSKHRILVQRHAKKTSDRDLAKKKSESPKKKKNLGEYDSAFYFDKVEEYLKVRNYLHLLKILDFDDKSKLYNQRIPNTLFAMSESFRLQLIAKTRKNIRRVADQLEQDRRQMKQEAITNSIILKSFDNHLRKGFINRMADKASGVNKDKRMGEERYKRRMMIIDLLDNVKFIKNYDKICVNLLMNTWARLAEMRGLPDRETIRVTFKGLEIPNTVIKPIFRVYVLVERKSTERSYPGPVNINGEPTYSEEKEILLNAILRYKVSEKAFYWKLARHSIEPFSNKGSESNDRFTLNLDSMSREYLDCVQLKFTLHDENDNLRALYFARLDHLYLPSKKGKDIAFAIGEEKNVQHIVFLQVHSHLPDRPFVVSRTKALMADYLQDTFFNFAFPFPNTTPREHKFLCLLPESWRILDDNMRNTHRSGNLGKWIQKVKYRLSRHYHKKSAGHIAKLEKANVLWAELQTELAVYSSGQPLAREQVYIDEDHLNRLTDIETILKYPNRQPLSGPNKENPTVVSYLFKRDRWENVPDWIPFYQKLRNLCILGLPSQLRKIVWSELGRTCYFIKLTENIMKTVAVQDPEYRSLDDKFPPHQLTESKRVYENLKYQAFRRYYYVYQELEEDIEFLRQEQGKKKPDYENELRSICKAFIHWSHMSAEFSAEIFRLYVSYSRSVLTLCQSLIISLNCNYLHAETHVEEDVVFWLLVSLTTYILSSYYETNEDAISVDIAADQPSQKARKNNKFTTSALRCFEMRGIKGDLLLLRILVREKLPEIFQKFEEMGLPLEQYFADHMLTLFSTMFGPAMVFRIWDLIFLEGSASNQVRSHRTIVIAIFCVLQNCKKMLLNAKNSNEIKYIIDIYSTLFN